MALVDDHDIDGEVDAPIALSTAHLRQVVDERTPLQTDHVDLGRRLAATDLLTTSLGWGTTLVWPPLATSGARVERLVAARGCGARCRGHAGSVSLAAALSITSRSGSF